MIYRAVSLRNNLFTRNYTSLRQITINGNRPASRIPPLHYEINAFSNQFCTFRTLSVHLTASPLNQNKLLQIAVRLKSTEISRSETPKTPEGLLSNSDLSKVSQDKLNEVKHPTADKLFSVPKSTLHNIYLIVSNELDKPSLKLAPSYKLLKEKQKLTWVCTYHLSWPEDYKVSVKDHSKKVASNKAALAVLTWLRERNRITEAGLPIIYDKEEVQQMKLDNTSELKLSRTTEQNLREIVEVFEEEMKPVISLENDSTEAAGVESIPEVFQVDNIDLGKTVLSQLSLWKYMAKEKVELPIAAYKEKLKDTLNSNRVMIVKGEPGCGKSTRVPQYVLETCAERDGRPGRIAVTQPRRIAAISLAERVAKERDEPVGHIVGHQVRLNSKFNPKTGCVLYCTTGILLRHLQSDPSLSHFSHVILDEAHERDVNTDLLMSLLKGAMDRNERLKLIVMSATIDTDMFSKYYDGAPVVEVPGFAYPVKRYFVEDVNLDLSKTKKMCEGNVPAVVHDDVVETLNYIHRTKPEGAILCFLPGWEDISKVQKLMGNRGDVVVYCLHSRLRDTDQWKIFSRPPPGIRKIILATNIAETSVTIDDVVYVVDSGIHKEQRFDVEKGVTCIDNHWISKSSSTQRKGRAGRVRPGECFHLYTSAKHDSFPEYTQPEIKRTSLTKIVLDSKVFVRDAAALEFMHQLPTPPDDEATASAVRELKELELLDADERLTSLGRTLTGFQLEPKLAKAMVNAVVFKCVTPVVDVATLFSSETELFVTGLMDKERVKDLKRRFSPNSDHLAMMKVFEKWLELKNDGSGGAREFCERAGLVEHKMVLIEKIRRVHFEYLYNGLHETLPISDDFSDNGELVKAVLLSGIGNVLQRRTYDIVKGRLKNNVNVFLTKRNHKATISRESVNFKRRAFPTDVMIYINETRSNIRRTTVIRECSLISNLATLLFSNGNLTIREVNKDTDPSRPDDQILLSLDRTGIKFFCDRTEAELIVECKAALLLSYQYFIRSLTETGMYDPEASKSWDKMLSLLSDVLYELSIKS